MARKKKKPDFNAAKITVEYIKKVADVYENEDITLRELADEFHITILKARKILITAGVYESEIADEVNRLYEEGQAIPQIQSTMNLSRASVHSYLPYSKIIYNCDEISTDAERIKKFRERKRTVKVLQQALESNDDVEHVLWETLILFQDYPFKTVKGLKFKYHIKGNEMFISRKEKTVTKATVNLALQRCLDLNRVVSGPKKMNCFGACYLYPIFVRIGVLKGS